MSHPAPTHTLVVSLANRVCAYFAVNDDEKLSALDIAIKFDCDKTDVPDALHQAVKGGLLCKGPGAIYRAGPNLNPANFGKAHTPAAPAAKPPRQPSGWATKGLAIDPASIPIRTDVPMPYGNVRKGNGENKWHPLLDRLTTPGMSASLPIVWRSALGKACTVYQNKTRKRFAVRVIDAKTVAVFRLEGEFTPQASKSGAQKAGA